MKIRGIAAAAVLLAAAGVGGVFAQGGETINLSGGALGNDGAGWSCPSGSTECTITGDVTITGTNSSANPLRFKIDASSSALNITLDGVTIGSSLASNQHAFAVEGSNTVTIKVKGANTVNGGGGNGRGLFISTGADVTIVDDNTAGSLLTFNNIGIETNGGLTLNGDVILRVTGTPTPAAAQFTHTKGITLFGNTNAMNGNVTIFQDFALSNALTIPVNSTLTIPVGVTLTATGAITTAEDPNGSAHGTIDNKGTITGNGRITNNGEIINNAVGSTITNTITGNGPVRKKTQPPMSFKLPSSFDGSSVAITGSDPNYAVSIPFRTPNFTLTTEGGRDGGTVTYARTAGTIFSVSSAGAVSSITQTGTLEITATKAGNNDYEPKEIKLTVTVTPKNLSDDDITITVASATYTGAALTPAVTVRYGTTNLAVNTDYTITGWANNTNATTGPTDSASVTITAAASSNYTGTKTVNFYIAPRNANDISTITVAIGSGTELVYSGSSFGQFLHPEVKINDTVRDRDTDYYIVYVRDGEEIHPDSTALIAAALTNAGSFVVRAKFKGNYTGSRDATAIHIATKSLTLDTLQSTFPNKVYDGTAAVDTSGMNVRFVGLVGGETLDNIWDYTISNAAYANATAGNDKSVSATITLISTGPRAKNYSLATNANTLRGRANITKRAPDTSHFNYAIPTGHRYAEGVGQGLTSAPTNRSGVTGMGTPITVLYNGSEDRPVDAGTYVVSLRVPEGTNYTEGTVTLGEYVIGDPLPPDITSQPFDIVVRLEDTTGTLRVTATSPNSGTLRYQWFTADGDSVRGATGSTFRPNIDSLGLGDYYYYVVVTNRVAVGTAGAQLASVQSDQAKITVLSPAKSIIGATVTITGEYTYTGQPITLPWSAVTVMLGGDELMGDSVDYRIDYDNNVGAGTASATIVGVNEYKNSIPRTFTIGKSELGLGDFGHPVLNVSYNGEPQPVVIPLTRDRDGMGAITISYTREGGAATTTPPTNAGIYEAKLVSIAAGTNFTAFAPDEPLLLGTYTISKKVPDVDDVIFDIPDNHVFTGSPLGIGEVTLKGTGYGSVTVRYNGSEETPSEIGVYVVTVAIEGGDNYGASTLTLGNYEIRDPVSIASSGRDILNAGGGDVAAVVPARVLDSKVSAGPNPVAGRGSAVSFYRTGALVRNGTLTVYDAAGNVVRRIAVNDGAAADANGARVIGTWDLIDARGRAVAVGTYLVRGSIKTADGKTERISIPIGVTR